MRRIAAFDFDGTLTRRDTLVGFLVAARGRARVARAVARVVPVAARARVGGTLDELHHRDVTKVRLLRELFAGQDAEAFAAAGVAYARRLPARLRPEVAERLDSHRAEGHEVVLVSASLGTYLRPFAEAHGIDHVIAVELEEGSEGRLTGDLVGPNVRGPEKEVRLRAWLGDDPAEIWAYGNSSGDRELLAMAHHPTWIGRAARSA